MRRPVFVTAREVAALHLNTVEGLREFRVARLGDPEDWTAELHACASGFVVILDYVGSQPPHLVRTMRVGGAHPHDGLGSGGR